MVDDEDEGSGDELPNARSLADAAADLQRLGERLVRLRDDDLASVPLAEDLRDAVLEARRLVPRTEAMRRQLQFVGKLMRKADPAAIERRLAAIERGDDAAGLQIHAEAWRARLLAEGDAGVQALVEAEPGADRQRLRQLVRRATKADDGAPRAAAERELEAELRAVLRALGAR